MGYRAHSADRVIKSLEIQPLGSLQASLSVSSSLGCHQNNVPLVMKSHAGTCHAQTVSHTGRLVHTHGRGLGILAFLGLWQTGEHVLTRVGVG